MAKKIIKAQMKQRIDTKANWASKNPVLLLGELGLVSDDLNRYKVGDGTTAWNALPFRGFNVVNETGTSENAVMSQKAVTEILTELTSKVEEINENLDNLPQGASMTPITYADLVALRDNGGLVAGSFYRITDYITTTAQENTQSAGHPFDVIVLALSENTLAEEAYAIKSERDTDGYFANSNLAAWKLWYSLDNDTERFAWADTENGKGVIYRMIDEWNNDCPYDFKNIQFKRSLNFDYGYARFSEEGNETWVYTFAGQSYHINNDEWSGMLDGSLESPFGHMSDEKTSTFHDNTIKPYIMLINGNEIYTECGLRYLNDIVFLGYWQKIGSANEEDAPYYYAYGCYSNSFGNDCHSNSFGSGCHSNSFGNGCHSNSFGDSCHSNSFGSGCHSNSFDDNCENNSFGNGCYSNSFGSACYSNSFGNGCHSNSFGDSCYSNSFGSGCHSNSFGNGCHSNSFGNDCNIVKLNERTTHKTASVNSNNQVKVFYLADFVE